MAKATTGDGARSGQLQRDLGQAARMAFQGSTATDTTGAAVDIEKQACHRLDIATLPRASVNAQGAMSPPIQPAWTKARRLRCACSRRRRGRTRASPGRGAVDFAGAQNSSCAIGRRPGASNQSALQLKAITTDKLLADFLAARRSRHHRRRRLCRATKALSRADRPRQTARIPVVAEALPARTITQVAEAYAVAGRAFSRPCATKPSCRCWRPGATVWCIPGFLAATPWAQCHLPRLSACAGQTTREYQTMPGAETRHAPCWLITGRTGAPRSISVGAAAGDALLDSDGRLRAECVAVCARLKTPYPVSAKITARQGLVRNRGIGATPVGKEQQWVKTNAMPLCLGAT